MSHAESPTVQIEAIHPDTITERPQPYIPSVPPVPETVPCCRCGRPMSAIRQKDAGWLKSIARAPGREDGEEILGYACFEDDCLNGAYDKPE